MDKKQNEMVGYRALVDAVTALEARVTALETGGVFRGSRPEASTATANQTYSLIPGDWVDQYCAAVEDY